MADRRTINIAQDSLPTTNIALRQKGRGSNKYLAWTAESNTILRNDGERGTYRDVQSGDAAYVVCLSETEIHEYSAQALKELEMAEDSGRHAVEDGHSETAGNDGKQRPDETEEERLLREHEEYVGTHDEAKAFAKKMQEKSCNLLKEGSKSFHFIFFYGFVEFSKNSRIT